MNKNRFTEFFKGKGYYVLLFIGVLAIAAVAIIGSQLSSNINSEDQDYVDLNDTDDNLTADNAEDADDAGSELADNNPVVEDIANIGDNTSDETVTNDDKGQTVSQGDQAELEGYENYSDEGVADQATDVADQTQVPDNTEDTAQAEGEDPAVETTGESLEVEASAIENLSFSMDESLLWPVEGNVLMDYSMDHTTYFATLQQYKVNPAIILGAAVGTEVKAATDGIITGIEENNPQTGYTMTMALGDGFSAVYGQLDKDSVSLKVGDSVAEGDVIGKVAAPSKYYTVEGSNLYFQILEDDESVNPMLLLR